MVKTAGRQAHPSASKDSGLIRYRLVVRNKAASRVLFAGFVTRLPIGMYSLGLLLLVQSEFGRFGPAGVVVALFAGSTSVMSPLAGRLFDRFGILVLRCGAMLGPALVVLVVVAVLERYPLPVVYGCTAAAGACMPPNSAAIRALLARTIPDDDLRVTAYSLDAIAVELTFLVAPAITAALAAAGYPAVAVGVACAVTLLGTLLVPSIPDESAARQAAGRARRRRPFVIASAGLAALVAAAVLQMIGVAFAEVAVPAAAVHAGVPALAGALLALWAIGSIIGALVFGSRSWPGSRARQYAILNALVAVGLVAPAFAHELWALFPLMAIAGLAIAPAFAAATHLVTRVVPDTARAEGAAWLGSGTAAGGSAGYALAGVAVDAAGFRWTFAAAAAFAALAVLPALYLSRRTAG